MSAAYYNEIDPVAAHVLRELIAGNVIARGDVDTRSIKDVKPDDLKSYTQCHFFAGGGLWSIAARLAGWPDERPLWTGSCPCQPFSQAGKGRGVDDERHLWPDFHRLITARRPSIVVGEQVAGKAGYGWLDGVRADLGAEGYASGAVDIPAAAVDAPHIRQRLYWVARRKTSLGRSVLEWPTPILLSDTGHIDRRTGPGEQIDGQELANLHGLYADANSGGRGGWQEASERGAEQRAVVERDHGMVNATGFGRGEGRAEPEFRSGRPAVAGANVNMGDSFGPRLEGHAWGGDGEAGRQEPDRPDAEADGGSRPLGHATASGLLSASQSGIYRQKEGPWPRYAQFERRNGSFWSDYEWVTCHDGKARRTKPGLRFLVNGYAGRVAAWRIAGNAIVTPLAAEVIKAVMEAEEI